MDPGNMETIEERKEFTEMTKNNVSYIVWVYAVRLGYTPPGLEDPENPSVMSPIESKLRIVQELEEKLEKEVLIHCDSASPIAVNNLFLTIISLFMVFWGAGDLLRLLRHVLRL